MPFLKMDQMNALGEKKNQQLFLYNEVGRFLKRTLSLRFLKEALPLDRVFVGKVALQHPSCPVPVIRSP